MDIKTYGVIGAGQMGAGIAQVAAMSGLNVIMNDIDTELVDRGVAGIIQGVRPVVRIGRPGLHRLHPRIPAPAAQYPAGRQDPQGLPLGHRLWRAEHQQIDEVVRVGQPPASPLLDGDPPIQPRLAYALPRPLDVAGVGV